MKKLIFIPLLALFSLAGNKTTAQSNSCDFIVTKTICLENGLKEICVEGLDISGTHEWDVTAVGGSCGQTHFTGQKICFQCTLSGNDHLLIDHTFLPLEGLPSSCNKRVNVSCNPDCSSWNFSTAFNADCSVTFTINPNFNADNITWVFGDGSNSVQTPNDIRSIAHTYSLPGTYQVCVTLRFDDYYYQTCCFDVYVPPCPECEPDPISWVECPPSGENCCIKFTFNSPWSISPHYIWNFGDQSPLDTTVGKTVEHSFIGRGPFHICVSYFVEDSTYTCCEWIDLPPCDCCESADFAFNLQPITNYQSCMGYVYKCEPACVRPGMTVHKWIYSDGTVIFTGSTNSTPPDHVFSNYVNTTGQVCVTHQILCDNQVIDEVTKCLPFYPGAYLGKAGQSLNMSDVLTNQSGITVFDFITQNASNPAVPLYIEGNLFVDINSNFNQSYWNMARNAQIIVNFDRTFGLNGTTIRTARRINPGFPCCRWTGIKANPKSILNWSSATITDAELMLELLPLTTSSGATLNFSDNSFLENVNGIRAFRHRPRFGNFHNNVFEGCKNCTVLCYCLSGTGIYIDMGGLTSLYTSFPVTGSRNTIRSYEYGIHAINTNLSAKNFYLHDIDQAGLWFVKNKATPFHLIIDLLEFHSMQAAIRDQISGGGLHRLTAAASVPYTSLRFSEIFKGYDISIDQSRMNGTISYNQIATNGGATNFGIKVSLTGSIGNQFTADHNQITVASGGNSCMGISLLADVDNQQNAVLKFNEITAVGLDPGAGIYVSNWKTSSVTDNTLTMGSPKPGIEFSNSGGSLIQCNGINFGTKGLLFNISPENDIVNNTCNANGLGVHFNGNCQAITGSFIAENKFQSNSQEGSLYNDIALTGIQHHQMYNSWLPVVSDVKARHPVKQFAEQCQFRAPVNAVKPSVHLPKHFVAELFIQDGPPAGFPQECSIGTGGENYLQYHSNDSLAALTYDELLGTIGLFDSLELPLANCMKQSIYELILLWPAWINRHPNIAAFYTAHTNGFIGQSSILRRQIKDFLLVLESQAIALNALYAQYDSLAGQLAALDLQLQFETDPVVIDNLLNQMSSIELQMEDLIQIISSQLQSNEQTNLTTINDFQTTNNNLSATTLDELNEKKINDIILKIWREEILTVTEEDDLREIAQYCYAYGGRAVFDAQNLCLNLFGEYYAQENCSNYFGGVQTRLRKNFELQLSPNPVRDELIIRLETSDENQWPDDLKLINSLGKFLDVELKRLDPYTASLPVGHLPSGLYFISAEQYGQRKLFKFVVNH
ncbi:MAG: right-handed parallel beta-helix repeat-containing protein [Saprospiraceae bacterium]|nr:right-handed parallel beta-helix repeat-containing protein [Saprospiraceae bacterium]MBP9210575.1 right-handed parallel beta-helix repeat-containing protein [Saprospiraceae bacterium]